MKVGVALLFGLAAALGHWGVRAFFGANAVVGSGDANAAYAAAAFVSSSMLCVLVVASILHLATLAGTKPASLPVVAVLIVLAVCACALGTVTFYLAPVAFAAVALYALWAAVAGRNPGDALAESCRIAGAAPGATALALAVVVAGTAVALGGAGLFAAIPLAGDAFAGFVSQLAVGLAAPGIGATYLKLRSRAEVS